MSGEKVEKHGRKRSQSPIRVSLAIYSLIGFPSYQQVIQINYTLKC